MPGNYWNNSNRINGMYQPMQNQWNPQQQPMQNGYFQNQQPPQSNIIRVPGPESAKSYTMGPSSSVILMDDSNPIFYLVSTDEAGFKNLRTFHFTEDKPEPAPLAVDSDIYATKRDLAKLQDSLDELRNSLEGLM